jgi:light-regulated signal transduction histidine kinase (bacteriophytochrome)
MSDPSNSDSEPGRVARLEFELASQRAEMQEFSYSVSHDLRAHLRHVLNYAQIIKEEAGAKLPPDLQGMLTNIGDSTRRMGEMLDALAELSRLATVPLVLGPVELQVIISELRAEIGTGTATIEWRITDSLPVVQADATLLRIALRHVLDNALKFSATRAHPVITVSASEADGCVSLQVQDNGVGFNPAMQDKLFRPFQRLHSARQFSGLGMGLAVTRKVAQRLGGRVSARPIEGGVIVELTLMAVAAQHQTCCASG